MKYIYSRDPDDKEQCLAGWLLNINPSMVSSIHIQSGYFSDGGLEFIKPLLKGVEIHSGEAFVIVGANDQSTSAEDAKALLQAVRNIKKGRCGICVYRRVLFHPKVIHISLIDGSAIAYVGSANLTKQGSFKNIEAALVLNSQEGDSVEVLDNIKTSIEHWFQNNDPAFYELNEEVIDRLIKQNILGESRTERAGTENEIADLANYGEQIGRKHTFSRSELKQALSLQYQKLDTSNTQSTNKTKSNQNKTDFAIKVIQNDKNTTKKSIDLQVENFPDSLSFKSQISLIFAGNSYWNEVHEEVIEAIGEQDINVEELWEKQNVSEVVSYTDLTETKAKTWLYDVKSYPFKSYDKQTQADALVIFKTLLVYYALMEEAKLTGGKDLIQALNDFKTTITSKNIRKDAFDNLGKMFCINLKNEQSRKRIQNKLQLITGTLSTTKEIIIAATVAVLYCDLVTQADITEVREGIIDQVYLQPFREIVLAKGCLVKLGELTTLDSPAGLLEKATNKALSSYSINTEIIGKISELQELAEQLNNIKTDTTLTDSEKILLQQKTIDHSNLDRALKELMSISSDADTLILGDELTTCIGQELGLTKDQEDAMLGSKTGLTLISAGAGSGKTRVLSGKVAQLLESNDELTPYNIMAVSFSRKSAQDLAEKVKNVVGSKIPQMSHTAVGRTTHSIAQEIVNRFHPSAGSSTVISDGHEQIRLIKRAISLVIKTPYDHTNLSDVSLFASQIDVIQAQHLKDDMGVLNLLIAVEKYRKDMGYLRSFEENLVKDLVEIRRKLLDDESLDSEDLSLVKKELDTDRGKKILNQVFAGDSSNYVFYTRTRSSYTLTDQTLPESSKVESSKVESSKVESSKVESSKNYTFKSKKKKASKSDKPQWWGSKVEGQEEPKINPKEAQLFITKCKANMVSPTEAYNKVNKPGMEDSFILKAKVYGAYAHILTEEGLSDFDDMLIEAVKVLSRKDYLKQLQKQYKHIIVDEAQDLNPVQHAFFGLLSGTMKAGGQNGNEPPVPVENPTMQEGRSITFIGDENQSIYGFRGAQSSEFSSKAVKNEGAFETMTLGVNFRSTKAIVDAANKLISDDDKSLGMICTAVFQEQDNGSDSIKRDTDHQSPYEAAGAFAETVAQGIGEYQTYKASDYGVACRTNAELIPYALSLLEQDIEFTCPVNPFKHPTTKKILRALSIASSMLGGGDGIGQFYGAFLNVHKDLNFGLSDEVNEVFKKHLKNPKSREELQNEFDQLEGDQQDQFFLVNIDDDMTTRAMAGSVLEIFRNEEGIFTDYHQNVSNYYCSLIISIQNASIRNPADLFDIIIGSKPIKGNTYLQGPDGETIGSMIEGMSKTHADEMAKALTSITSEEEIQELKTVDFAMAPLVALRSIFLKGVKENKGVDEILSKFSYLESKTGEAAKKSRDQGVDAVTLDTIHGWKGLEVTHLTVPMVAGKFPSDKEDFDPIVHNSKEQAATLKKEQERMLAYVAVTRGKKSVTVQSYQQTGGGKEAGESEYISRIFGEEDCSIELS